MACSTFLQERITSIKARIVAYEDASAALAGGGVQSYTLDTGQTRQTVTKFDLADIEKTIASLYNQLVTLEARCTGNGVVVTRPSW
jgi:hypothetical protein